MPTLQRFVTGLVCSSVALGVILLYQLWFMVPRWLFYSVLLGWVAYLFTAIAMIQHRHGADKAAFVLAILTLVVSVPQPEHYALMSQGLILPTITFILGSVLQLFVIISLSILYLRRKITRKGLREK